MRLAWFLVSTWLVVPFIADAQVLGGDSRCQSIRASGEIHVGKRVLTEAGDLAPELRRINELVTNQCLGEAVTALQEFREAHPEDYSSAFVEARLLWGTSGVEAAKSHLQPVVDAHPEFASGQVLLAGMALDRNDYAAARVHLDQARRAAPNDLWLSLYSFRLQTREGTDSSGLIPGILELANAREVPPGCREYAAGLLESTPLTPEQQKSVMRASLQYESGTPRNMKITTLAWHLIEDPKDRLEGQALLSDLLETEDILRARVLLAASYLLDAAHLDAEPSTKNAVLVQKARATMRGDLSKLAVHSFFNYTLTRAILPFIAEDFRKNPNVIDTEYGETLICKAAARGDIERMRFAVDNGTDVNIPCTERNPVRVVIGSVGGSIADKRSMIQMLLANGADPLVEGELPPELVVCKMEAECGAQLAPLLEEYLAKHQTPAENP